MAGFKTPKQRAWYFAKKSGKPQNAVGVKPIPAIKPIQSSPTIGQIKVPGLNKSNKFARIKRFFKY